MFVVNGVSNEIIPETFSIISKIIEYFKHIIFIIIFNLNIVNITLIKIKFNSKLWF
jgi:hypothetical protein